MFNATILQRGKFTGGHTCYLQDIFTADIFSQSNIMTLFKNKFKRSSNSSVVYKLLEKTSYQHHTASDVKTEVSFLLDFTRLPWLITGLCFEVKFTIHVSLLVFVRASASTEFLRRPSLIYWKNSHFHFQERGHERSPPCLLSKQMRLQGFFQVNDAWRRSLTAITLTKDQLAIVTFTECSSGCTFDLYFLW